MFPANELSENLRRLGIELKRFKTGTPARVHADTLDYSKMELEEGDEKIVPFSFETENVGKNLVPCYLVYTNEKTHQIIHDNLGRSAMYGGMVEGFLSVNKRHRKEHLELVKNDTHTLIFYEAPHKLKNTLSDMQKTFGGDRKIALVRELTKIHEEVKRCTIDEAIAYYSENNPRGEYVLVVEGAKEVEETEENEWENISIKEHVDKYIAEGMTSKDAIKKAAADRNLPKRDVYNEYHRGE